MRNTVQQQEKFGFTGDGAWFPRMIEFEDDGLEEPESFEEIERYEDLESYEASENYEEPRSFQRTLDEEEPMSAPKELAPVIAVVGGSGGVGRSTIALLAASLAAAEGIDTVLLEGDLQFGDMAFWLGLDDSQPSLANPTFCEPIRCEPGFDLYRAPVFPEAADEAADDLFENLDRFREGRGLLIADTGAYWSGFTAQLLLNCDLFLIVADQRPASVAAAIKASELCARLGVPSTRMVAVFNKWSSKCTLNAKEFMRALDASQVCCIPDGKDEVDEAIRAGDILELEEDDNPVVQGIQDLLEKVLPRVGRMYQPESGKKKGLFR